MEIWIILAISFIAEIIEVAWQYSSTFEGVMKRIYVLYRRSIFLLLLAHTGYLYILYISLKYDLLDWPIIVAIALKTLDIFTKIEFVRSIYVKQDIDERTKAMMDMKFPLWMWITGPLTYPWLIYLGFIYR